MWCFCLLWKLGKWIKLKVNTDYFTMAWLLKKKSVWVLHLPEKFWNTSKLFLICFKSHNFKKDQTSSAGGTLTHLIKQVKFLQCYQYAVIYSVVSQRDGSGLNLLAGWAPFCCGVSMFPLRLCRFSLGMPAFLHSPKKCILDSFVIPN